MAFLDIPVRTDVLPWERPILAGAVPEVLTRAPKDLASQTIP